MALIRRTFFYFCSAPRLIHKRCGAFDPMRLLFIILTSWTSVAFGQVNRLTADCKKAFDTLANKEVYNVVDIPAKVADIGLEAVVTRIYSCNSCVLPKDVASKTDQQKETKKSSHLDCLFSMKQRKHSHKMQLKNSCILTFYF